MEVIHEYENSWFNIENGSEGVGVNSENFCCSHQVILQLLMTDSKCILRYKEQGNAARMTNGTRVSLC